MKPSQGGFCPVPAFFRIGRAQNISPHAAFLILGKVPIEGPGGKILRQFGVECGKNRIRPHGSASFLL